MSVKSVTINALKHQIMTDIWQPINTNGYILDTKTDFSSEKEPEHISWQIVNTLDISSENEQAHVTHKNSKLLKEFKAKYPGCEKSSSKYSDQYDKLIIEAMGGKGDNDIEKEDKIIRNIAKTVTIDKSGI